MKKNKKLVLKRETVRSLLPSELEAVAGGTATTAPNCSNWCHPVPTTAVVCGGGGHHKTTAVTCTGGPATTAINCTL